MAGNEPSRAFGVGGTLRATEANDDPARFSARRVVEHKPVEKPI